MKFATLPATRARVHGTMAAAAPASYLATYIIRNNTGFGITVDAVPILPLGASIFEALPVAYTSTRGAEAVSSVSVIDKLGNLQTATSAPFPTVTISSRVSRWVQVRQPLVANLTNWTLSLSDGETLHPGDVSASSAAAYCIYTASGAGPQAPLNGVADVYGNMQTRFGTADNAFIAVSHARVAPAAGG